MIKRHMSEARAEVASLVIQGTRALEEAGIENPGQESLAVMAALLRAGRAGVFARLRDELGKAERHAFIAWIERRVKREPLQYITGQAEFCGLSFAVSPDVLVPRPETEILVQEGISFLKDWRGEGCPPDDAREPADGTTEIPIDQRDKPRRLPGDASGCITGGEGGPVIADIGTGSGCIAVALAVNLPDAAIHATDISRAALDAAAMNARAHGVDGRIRFYAGDLIGALEGEGLQGRLDLVVSNPPYIPSDEIATLQMEVRFEPSEALDGGPDGLDAIGRIIREAPVYLKAGGALLMEIGFMQSGAVKALVDVEPGLKFERFIPDFAGIERVLVVRRK